MVNNISSINNSNNTERRTQNNKEISNTNKINYTKSDLNLTQSDVTDNEVKLIREITELKNQNKDLLEKLNRFVKQSEKFKVLKRELKELRKIEKERQLKAEKKDNTQHNNEPISVPLSIITHESNQNTKQNAKQNTKPIINKTKKHNQKTILNDNEIFLNDFLSNNVITLRPSLLNFNDRILVQNPFENMGHIMPQNLEHIKCKDNDCKNKYMFYTYKSNDDGKNREGKEVQVIGDGNYATVTEKSLPSGKKRVFKIKPSELPKLLKM